MSKIIKQYNGFLAQINNFRRSGVTNNKIDKILKSLLMSSLDSSYKKTYATGNIISLLPKSIEKVWYQSDTLVLRYYGRNFVSLLIKIDKEGSIEAKIRTNNSSVMDWKQIYTVENVIESIIAFKEFFLACKEKYNLSNHDDTLFRECRVTDERYGLYFNEDSNRLEESQYLTIKDIENCPIPNSYLRFCNGETIKKYQDLVKQYREMQEQLGEEFIWDYINEPSTAELKNKILRLQIKQMEQQLEKKDHFKKENLKLERLKKSDKFNQEISKLQGKLEEQKRISDGWRDLTITRQDELLQKYEEIKTLKNKISSKNEKIVVLTTELQNARTLFRDSQKQVDRILKKYPELG